MPVCGRCLLRRVFVRWRWASMLLGNSNWWSWRRSRMATASATGLTTTQGSRRCSPAGALLPLASTAFLKNTPVINHMSLVASCSMQPRRRLRTAGGVDVFRTCAIPSAVCTSSQRVATGSVGPSPCRLGISGRSPQGRGPDPGPRRVDCPPLKTSHLAIAAFRQRIDTCELGAQTVATDQGGLAVGSRQRARGRGVDALR